MPAGVGHVPLLAVRDVTKRFSGVLALDQVSVTVEHGEVLALVGENGAGKSTLINVIGGVLRPDEGSIEFEGHAVSRLDPHIAQGLGISIIHQESELAPTLSAAENLFLGRPPRYLKHFVAHRRLHAEARDWLDRVGAEFSTKTLARDLSIPEKRLLELARAISMNAKLVIMDEPTTVFADREVQHMFRIVQDLRSCGVSILYISHRLKEIFSVADRVTVLRDGRQVATCQIGEVSEDQLVHWMVGRDLDRVFPRRNHRFGAEAFSVSGLTRRGVIHDVSFSVREGEILGLAGLVGAGRTEVANAIFGATRRDGGEIRLGGQRIDMRSPSDAIRHGIGYVTADRKLDGLLLGKSLKENIALASLQRLAWCGFIKSREEKTEVLKFKDLLAIKTPGIQQLVMYLSGGNQQKAVFARWLMVHAKVLILDEPTVGIDVGAKQEIYSLVNDIAEEGRCVILISSELPEVLGMCDRILVMHKGRITRELSRDGATQEEILRYSAGLREAASADTTARES